MKPSRKLRVVHDVSGNILAATLVDSSMPKSRDTSAPRVDHGEPARSGQAVTELEVPQEMAKLELHEIVQQLRVRGRLVPKDSTSY